MVASELFLCPRNLTLSLCGPEHLHANHFPEHVLKAEALMWRDDTVPVPTLKLGLERPPAWGFNFVQTRLG